MRFWDSSALVPLCLRQPRTEAARALCTEDAEMVVWWGSAIECSSAIARLHRDGLLTAGEERAARNLLDLLRRSWYEVQPGDGVREQALRLLRVHPLRAADALQLAAGLEWSGTPARGGFVTFDARLQEAAHREGFRTLGIGSER
ncbi:MAG: type II toxin-antitoxin system VapC family toxin [Gemmatimonadales bacterium]|nr:type II toxin-antitoxin system VapC family toxin [Gemmatimonadales bacterium]